MEHQLKEKLAALEDGQQELLRRFDDMNKTMKNIVAEVGGVPDIDFREKDRRSLRWRLHALENDREAVKIAGQAVEAAMQAREDVVRSQRAESMNRFTKREKILGLVIAVLLLISPYISAIAFHH